MLAKRAERLDKKMSGDARGAFPFLTILQSILGMLGLCPQPVTPTPPNPTPTPTPAQSAAWEDAWKLKSTATAERQADGSYSGPGYRKTLAKTRQQSRRDGKKMKKVEAAEATANMFDDAISSTLPDMYSDVCEARHVA